MKKKPRNHSTPLLQLPVSRNEPQQLPLFRAAGLLSLGPIFGWIIRVFPHR
jgi:hypothetical protein